MPRPLAAGIIFCGEFSTDGKCVHEKYVEGICPESAEESSSQVLTVCELEFDRGLYVGVCQGDFAYIGK